MVQRLFLFVFICVLLFLPLDRVWAEEIFFLDGTEGELFAPLASFLKDELHLRLSFLPSLRSEREELMVTLAGQKAYFLFGYNRDGFLFFEVWDLEKSRKVLGMVRRIEDASHFLEDLKRRLAGLLRREREWKILFVRYDEGQSSIVLTSLQGGREVSFLPPEGGRVEAINLTPEGRFLLATVSSGNMTSVFRMDLLSHSWHRLSPGGFSDSLPVFFPFHQTVLFFSERGENRGIYEMHLDGSKQRLLLKRENPIQWITASLYAPIFAFSEFRNGRWRLILWDTLRKEEQVVDFPGNVLYPTFGGQRELFFIGEEEGRYDVYRLSLPEGTVKRLTFDGLPKTHLTVSPGGGKLAFSTEIDRSNWDIVILELGRGKSERLTASWAKETSPVFSPVPMY